MPEKGIENLDTFLILKVLKKRYKTEMAIQDYIEMIECEVIALEKEQGIILQKIIGDLNA